MAIDKCCFITSRFLPSYLPDGRVEAVRAALRHLIAVPLRVDHTGGTLVYDGAVLPA